MFPMSLSSVQKQVINRNGKTFPISINGLVGESNF